jgi:hypothetical protein
MAFRFPRALALATACFLPLGAACFAVGCGSSDSSSAPAADAVVPLMVDGLYVNQTPDVGPYSQISFTGYIGRYTAVVNPCADPTDGSCNEYGSFSADADGNLTLQDDAANADGSAHITTLPFTPTQTLQTGTRPAPAEQIDLSSGETGDVVITIGTGSSDAGTSSGGGTLISITGDGGGALVFNANLGAIVQLITQLALGTSNFTLVNDNNGQAVSASNPPAAAPVGTTSSSNPTPTTIGSPGTGSSSSGSTATTADAGATASALIHPVAMGKINPNHLMDDTDMLGGSSITVAKVQALLASQNSALATLNQGGMSAAQIIVSQSQANGISPLYIIARIETESGLIHSTTTRNITSATGCGCPDGSACNVMVAGFSSQVACAAKLMAGYTKALQGGGSTVSGWKTSVAKKTLDPCTVTPDGIASAASYTYTPWVGAYSSGTCGSLANGGSTLLGTMIVRYKAALN